MKSTFLLALASCLLPAGLSAQSWRLLPGSGCPQIPVTAPPPSVSGPLTIGSTLTLDSLGVCTPFYVWEHGNVGPTSIHFGVAQPASSWIPFSLFIDYVPYACNWAVTPVMVTVPAPVDASRNYVPLPLPIPNDPNLRGATIAIQSTAWAWLEAYSMSPGRLVSQALEVTIG